MSKSILVIDMPSSCGNCPFLEIYYSEENDCEYQKCVAKHRIYITDTETIHERCPLKPMPESKEELYYPHSEYEIAVNEGYNKCLDEILGEEK